MRVYHLYNCRKQKRPSTAISQLMGVFFGLKHEEIFQREPLRRKDLPLMQSSVPEILQGKSEILVKYIKKTSKFNRPILGNLYLFFVNFHYFLP